ncbi:hypothetical protein B1992_09805 [Pseudoxanthomonas broegbernensis]|uniref:SPOR domain-containing protein n=1 Tax=Pseudoxanthomonas broegbernensis TaxID=83619 RepID=A0A7V8GLW6_9GAMM|nr:SPOR domain-containing protein [Pseudoxanthomonas broegbernensis]KAF1685990.1 hypothetical protein B1992_09805 [Pseudoxanthomonas broegbernensis]MBB6063756.1 cell division protein FtsN [Pseudoxanthomonas broegbernensis]
MLARALIVVLLALNLGVAAWWLLRPSPPPYRVPASDAGGLELRLVPPPAGGAPAAPLAASGPSRARQCLRAGPFAELVAAQAAQAALAGLADGMVLEEVPGEAAGYRVLLPPADDLAEAQALAGRIAAAGVQDYLIVRQGEETHAIALGSYRSREAAQRRLQALRDAGFPAVLRAQGRAASSQWWLELEVDSVDADAARARLEVEGTETAACLLPRDAATSTAVQALR